MGLIPIPWEGKGSNKNPTNPPPNKDQDLQLKADLKAFIAKHKKINPNPQAEAALWQIMALIGRANSMSAKELAKAELIMQDLIVYLQRLKNK